MKLDIAHSSRFPVLIAGLLPTKRNPQPVIRTSETSLPTQLARSAKLVLVEVLKRAGAQRWRHSAAERWLEPLGFVGARAALWRPHGRAGL